MTIVPRWEWRTFGDSFGQAESRFASLSPERAQESDDLYLLSRASDASVKVRDGLITYDGPPDAYEGDAASMSAGLAP